MYGAGIVVFDEHQLALNNVVKILQRQVIGLQFFLIDCGALVLQRPCSPGPLIATSGAPSDVATGLGVEYRDEIRLPH